MRKQLEKKNICDALKGCIQYFATRYRESHDQEGRVAVCLDGVEVFKSCYFDWCETRGEVVKDMPHLRHESNSAWEYWDKVHLETGNRGSFDQFVFYDAFYFYQNHDIEDCVASPNAIIRLFAILDRHIGKRRLQKLLFKIEQQPDWLKFFYALRFEAEGIPVQKKKGIR